MRVRVEKDASSAVAALAADTSTLWTVVGIDAAASESLAVLDRQFPNRDLTASLTPAERERAAEMSREFFAEVVDADPSPALNFSARVPLAIPDWDEIQNIFRLRVLAQRSSEISIVIWVADRRLGGLLACAGLPLPTSGQAGFGLRFFMRATRTLARCLIHRTPRIPAGARIWFSLGGALTSKGRDTYYADWPSQAPEINFRIYLAAGRTLHLGSDGSQAPLEAFGKVTDVLGACWESMGSLEPRTKFRDSSDELLWQQLSIRECKSGDRFALAFQGRAFLRILRQLKPESVVVPFEFRAWERVLTNLAKGLGIGVVGYQHSSLTPRHLALTTPGPDWKAANLPDCVITCGEVTAARLQPLAAATGITVSLGAALRISRMELPPPGDAILVAISSSRGESLALIRAAARIAQLLPRRIIIRPHPTIPVDDLFRQLSWPDTVELSHGRPLHVDLAQAGFVIYSSSTVALEGMLHDRLPVYLDIGDVLSGDPIDDGVFKLKASDAEELAARIDETSRWSEEYLASLQEHGRVYAERYLRRPTPQILTFMTTCLKV